MKRVALLLLPLFIIACASKPDPEQGGAAVLEEARQLYAQGQYAAARDSIMSLRQHHPKAIGARLQAILLLDSVEIQLAEGDTLKQEFFRRKLQHDIEGLGMKD